MLVPMRIGWALGLLVALTRAAPPTVFTRDVQSRGLGGPFDDPLVESGATYRVAETKAGMLGDCILGLQGCLIHWQNL